MLPRQTEEEWFSVNRMFPGRGTKTNAKTADTLLTGNAFGSFANEVSMMVKEILSV